MSKSLPCVLGRHNASYTPAMHSSLEFVNWVCCQKRLIGDRKTGRFLCEVCLSLYETPDPSDSRHRGSLHQIGRVELLDLERGMYVAVLKRPAVARG